MADELQIVIAEQLRTPAQKAARQLVAAYHAMRGIAETHGDLASIEDAIDVIALREGRRVVASWFDPRDIERMRLVTGGYGA